MHWNEMSPSEQTTQEIVLKAQPTRQARSSQHFIF